MITFGRRGGALLLGIATGSMLIGSVAVAAPATVVPPSLQSLLGEAQDSPPTSPASTRPPWRTAAPVAAALPTAAAVPADPALAILNPPLPEVPPPTTTPEAVPVRALVDTQSHPVSGNDTAAASSADSASADASATRFISGVIKLTNKERHDAGCADLAPDSRLTQAAQQHATDMAKNDYFAHESQDGTRFDTRIRAEGYSRPGGENIAMGQTSPEQVVREWMASPPHRRLIETCALTTIGVGYDDAYWVQDFGR